MNDLNFKEWLGEDHWKAIKYAVRNGKKAYVKKRKEQKIAKKPVPEKVKIARENLHKWLTERRVAFLASIYENKRT